MKKNTWVTFILASFLGFLVICCTHGLSPESKVKGDGVTVGDQLTINIKAEENLEIFAMPKTKRNARTISAEAFTLQETSPLKFYLSGKATNGQILTPKEVTVTADDAMSGKVTLDIDCYNWELTLAAVESELTFPDGSTYAEQCALVKENAVLIGSATVDMVFTNSISFTLSPRGLEKLGSVALAIAREGDWPIPEDYTVSAGIYDLTTREEISVYDASTGEVDDTGSSITEIEELDTTSDPAETAPLAGKWVPADFDIDDFDADEATYNAGGYKVKPGSYLFEIRLTKTGENRSYVWNDTIIVLPGKESNMINILNDSSEKDKTKLLVIPNLIGEKPEAPSSFAVTCSGEDADASGYYSANFTWNQSNVSTETNFALELLELKDTQVTALATTPQAVNDTTWATLKTGAENEYIFDYLHDLRKDPRFYKEGTLFANSTSVTLLLELGKCYVARLRSENNAGYSTGATYICTSDNKYRTINKYRVTYHLQGGVWEIPAAKTQDQVEYGSYGTDYTVIAPVGVTTAGVTAGTSTVPYLHDGVAKWTYWTKGLNGEKYPSDATEANGLAKYTSYKNLDLYAKYSREGDVTVYDDNDYDIFQNYLSGLEQEGNTEDTVISKNEKITISKAKTTNEGTAEAPVYSTTVSVTLPDGTDAPEWKYDKVIFEVTYGGRTYVADEQVGAARGEANEFKFYLTNFQTGYVYNCKITAHYQRTVVSYPFALYLTD